MPMGPLRDLGPCEVWYNGSKIGDYYDSVGFRYTQEDAPVLQSAFGNTPVDCIVVGSGPVEVTVPFTRLSLADLAVVLPGGSRSSGGATSGNVEMKAKDEIGASEYDNAAELILKPIISGITTDNRWWLHIPKAYPRADYDFSYDTSNQRVFNTVFKGFPNATNGLMWHIGSL